MRIGELSERSRVPVRMLRYYEEQGLLRPARRPNGYRDYQESDVARAQRVSSLIRSGLPTRLIAALLEDRPDGPDGADADRELADLFAAELARLEADIACRTVSRDTVRRYLARGPARATPEP